MHIPILNRKHVFPFALLLTFFISCSVFAANEPAVQAPVASLGVVTYIGAIKDSTNIIFFIIVGLIGVLSYLQARKTIFTPIKTEVFKLQLKALEDVLVYFEKHEDTYIDSNFDYEKIFYLNTFRMFDSYIDNFFGDIVKIDEEKRKDKYKELVGGVVSQKFMEENFTLVDDFKKTDETKEEPQITNPSIILAKWQKYEHGAIEFTAKNLKHMETIRRFRVSPLLPNELKQKIGEFEHQAHENLMLIGETLTSAAKELPEKYQSVEDLQRAAFDWLWNKYNHKKPMLTDAQNDILKFVSNYLSIDNLLEK
jgi:hypothetical protein